ncbi:hypothetical protein BGZ74_006179 [Mortierella antarctica]|nr:hypothetical protein BGZ74_006179 [Mortierella antarctica]
MRKALLLAGVFASVANAYYYVVKVMANENGRWIKCVTPRTYDYQGTNPETGKPWPGIAGPCLADTGKSEYLEFRNSDWRLNQFYNVSIVAGDSFKQVRSLKTKESGLVVPCIQVDEYHAPYNNPSIDDSDEFPTGFPNHWLYICTAPEIYRNRTQSV